MKRDKKEKTKNSDDDFKTGPQPGTEVSEDSEDDVTEGELVDLDHLADEPGEIVFGDEPLPA